MAKRKVEYQETYKKGVEAEKETIIKMLNIETTKVFIINAGKYDDGKEFITITIDDL